MDIVTDTFSNKITNVFFSAFPDILHVGVAMFLALAEHGGVRGREQSQFTAGHGDGIHSPVTYISMPSLKVKMVVVLGLALALMPCFTSLMVS